MNAKCAKGAGERLSYSIDPEHLSLLSASSRVPSSHQPARYPEISILVAICSVDKETLDTYCSRSESLRSAHLNKDNVKTCKRKPPEMKIAKDQLVIELIVN